MAAEEPRTARENDGYAPRLEDDGLEMDADLYERLLSEPDLLAPPRPINWNLLRAHELEAELLELNQWVDWLRHTYGLPPSVIPPLWHRHPECLWELSALRSFWLSSYDPEQAATGPLAFHKEFAAARARLRDWVQTCGTRLDTDRPTRQAAWPGEAPQEPIEDEPITNRDEDFLDFVEVCVAERQQAEDHEIEALLARRPPGR